MEEPGSENGEKPQAYIVLQHPSGSLVCLLLTFRHRAAEAACDLLGPRPPLSRSGYLKPANTCHYSISIRRFMLLALLTFRARFASICTKASPG